MSATPNAMPQRRRVQDTRRVWTSTRELQEADARYARAAELAHGTSKWCAMYDMEPPDWAELFWENVTNL